MYGILYVLRLLISTVMLNFNLETQAASLCSLHCRLLWRERTHTRRPLSWKLLLFFVVLFSYTIKNPPGSKHLCSPCTEKHTFCQQLSWRDTLQGYPVYTFPIIKQRVEVCIWGDIKHPLHLPLCQCYQCLSLLCYASFSVLLNSFPKCHKTMGTTLLF